MHGSSWTRRVLVAGVAGALAAAVMAPPLAAHAKKYGDWQTAAPVTGLNSAATEGCPIESPDGTQLFVMSTRGAGGDQDIWVASRDDTDEPFGAPEELPAPVNSPANDYCPTPLRGKWLLFVSDRGGVDGYGTTACGAGDIYLTRRSPATGRWATSSSPSVATISATRSRARRSPARAGDVASKFATAPAPSWRCVAISRLSNRR